MNLDKFESAIDPEQYKKDEAKQKTKHGTWYTLTFEAFLEYFYMVQSGPPSFPDTRRSLFSLCF